MSLDILFDIKLEIYSIFLKIHIISKFVTETKEVILIEDLLNGKAEISKKGAEWLLEYMLKRDYIAKVKNRAKELGYNFNDYREYHKILLIDIAYNTGSVSKWRKVFNPNATSKEVLKECRRKQRELDSRVAKIGYQLGIINSLEEAKELGLTQARYIL